MRNEQSYCTILEDKVSIDVSDMNGDFDTMVEGLAEQLMNAENVSDQGMLSTYRWKAYRALAAAINDTVAMPANNRPSLLRSFLTEHVKQEISRVPDGFMDNYVHAYGDQIMTVLHQMC